MENIEGLPVDNHVQFRKSNHKILLLTSGRYDVSDILRHEYLRCLFSGCIATLISPQGSVHLPLRPLAFEVLRFLLLLRDFSNRSAKTLNVKPSPWQTCKSSTTSSRRSPTSYLLTKL